MSEKTPWTKGLLGWPLCVTEDQEIQLAQLEQLARIANALEGTVGKLDDVALGLDQIKAALWQLEQIWLTNNR